MRARATADPPHVAHVGYHKTASTWLQVSVFPHLARYRVDDPQLKRLGIDVATLHDDAFDVSAARRAIGDIVARSRSPVLVSNEGLSGALWEGDARGLRSAERLADVMPGARILLLVRRQAEMLRSIHAQYVNEGGTCGLAAFVDGHRVAGCRFDLRHLEYDRLAARYVELFGRDRVWITPYERLRDDPGDFVAALCEILGTSLKAEVSRARRNRSLSPPSLAMLRAWNRVFRASVFNPSPIVALSGGRRIRRLAQQRVDPLLRRLMGNGARHRDGPMLTTLAERFEESNARLQELCDDSLARWSYPLPASHAVALTR